MITKKIFFVHCLLLISGAAVFAQTSKSDLERLRKEVGLPSTVSIVKNDSFFPSAKTVKIYLAIKHNKDAAEDFVNWVKKWNRTDAVRYGLIQITDDLTEADIAAVQYRSGTRHYVREESVQLKIGKLPPADENDDEIVLRSAGNSAIKAKSSGKTLNLPVYTYLVVRGQSPYWLVNYSRVDDAVSDQKMLPELLLQSAIADRLKKR